MRLGLGYRFLGYALFLRHGQTEYTNVFPDLTLKGQETIRKSARRIKCFSTGSKRIGIISSPRVRALGSSAIIAEEMEYKEQILQEIDLQAAVVRDQARGKQIFQEHMTLDGTRGLSVAYSTDPCYEDPEIFEPRSEVKKRFYGYLAKLVKGLLTTTRVPVCLVHVSHYEVLYHLVEDLFLLDYQIDEPLGFGEIIVISLYDIMRPGLRDVVEITVTFRNKTTRAKLFDCSKQKIL